MKHLISVFLLAFSLMASASNSAPLPKAKYVDIERYIGDWYAISSLPQFFTRGCLSQTASYSVINSQTISVLNTCYKKKSVTKISGQAVVINAATNAELEVTFNNFFTRLFRVKGDYTIIKLDPEYRYVLVGSKDRKSLWILAREKTMTVELYEAYVGYAKENGFPVERLQKSVF